MHALSIRGLVCMHYFFLFFLYNFMCNAMRKYLDLQPYKTAYYHELCAPPDCMHMVGHGRHYSMFKPISTVDSYQGSQKLVLIFSRSFSRAIPHGFGGCGIFLVVRIIFKYLVDYCGDSSNLNRH
jgi:hypothetical protein